MGLLELVVFKPIGREAQGHAVQDLAGGTDDVDGLHKLRHLRTARLLSATGKQNSRKLKYKPLKLAKSSQPKSERSQDKRKHQNQEPSDGEAREIGAQRILWRQTIRITETRAASFKAPVQSPA